jgi:cytochrome c oxidase subunit 4
MTASFTASIDPAQLLVVASALLMVAAILGVMLSLIFGKPITIPDEPAAAEEILPERVAEEALPGRRAAFRRGIYVLIALAVLTGLEFIIATSMEGSVALLFIIALVKAGLILQYYMHLNSVWSEEEAH